jgi:hypothetical protein
MGNRAQPYDKADSERRTPATDDIAPEGMDSELEGDELEASTVEEFEQLDSDDHVEPDGANDTPTKH